MEESSFRCLYTVVTATDAVTDGYEALHMCFVKCCACM